VWARVMMVSEHGISHFSSANDFRRSLQNNRKVMRPSFASGKLESKWFSRTRQMTLMVANEGQPWRRIQIAVVLRLSP